MSRSRISGVNRLRRKLRRLPDTIQTEVVRAVQDGGNRLEREVIAETPVDEGELRDTLKKQFGRDKLSVRVGWWEKGNLRNWRKAGWRAQFTLFGTKGSAKHNIPAQPANHFLHRAFKRVRSQIRGRINQAIDTALEKASKL